MNGIFDSTLSQEIETQDSGRWHGIHRAPRKAHRTRRIALSIAAVIAVGTLAPLNGGGSLPPTQAEASVTAQAVDLPRVTDQVSRSARVASARTARINKVINYALAQRGDKYRWGAAGPSKWDCSGLVMMSFRKAGIKLPHYTGGIQKRGNKVSKKNLKRGDVIFPQRGHVGIYLGNGKMVHASSGHGKVIIANVYGFYTARRMIK